MTDEKRRSHIYPIEVECPTCGVRRGVACRTAGGNHRHAHDPRIQAAWVATRQAITEQRLQYEALKALREQAAVYAEEDAESTYDEGKGPGTLVHFACGLPDDQCTCWPNKPEAPDEPLCGSPINPARTGPTGGTTCNYPLGHGKVSPDGVSQTYEHGVKGTSLYWTPWPEQAPKVKYPGIVVTLAQGDGLVGDVAGLEAIRRVRIAAIGEGMSDREFLNFLDYALCEGGKYVSEAVREWVTVL